MRFLDSSLDRARAGDYEFISLKGREIKNSNFGVIGLGSIGNRVAELASGFGANVHYWSKTTRNTSYTYLDLEQLITTCDVISVNVAEVEETNNLLNVNNLGLIKDEAIIISTVPPSIIQTEAIVSAVNEKKITFISDHPDEMAAKDLETLKSCKGVVFYPPIGVTTDGAMKTRQERFVGNIAKFLDGKAQNVVN